MEVYGGYKDNFRSSRMLPNVSKIIVKLLCKQITLFKDKLFWKIQGIFNWLFKSIWLANTWVDSC